MSSVLLDTSFFIRLFDEGSDLHNNAKAYYKYFLYENFIIKISTIAIAEFCVKGALSDLPLKNMQIIPFNIFHAERSGELMGAILEEKEKKTDKIKDRNIVINDVKMFAQADLDNAIDFFVSSDVRAVSKFSFLKDRCGVRFKYIDINIPHNEVFGILPFK